MRFGLRFNPPVTDVVAGGVVVPSVHLSQSRSVQMHRDRDAIARIPYPVNAPVVGKYARGPVFPAPHELPDLIQARVIGPTATIETLVALLEYGAHSTAVNSPGGMVVDSCLRVRRPDEHLQREGMFFTFVRVGYVPASFSAPCQKRADLTLEEGGLPHESDQKGS